MVPFIDDVKDVLFGFAYYDVKYLFKNSFVGTCQVAT